MIKGKEKVSVYSFIQVAAYTKVNGSKIKDMVVVMKSSQVVTHITAATMTANPTVRVSTSGRMARSTTASG